MSNSVYKSEHGEKLIKELTYEIYNSYNEYEYQKLEVNTKAGKTHVLHFGDISKPAIFMIHGTMSNSATWFGSIKKFINDFSIYLIDIPGEPGLSESNRIKLKTDLPELWLLDLFNNLSIENASLITMSLGSWYGINFAVLYPERIKSISLLTTSGIYSAKISFIFKVLLYMFLGKKGQKLLNNEIYYKTPQITDYRYIKYQEYLSKYFKPMLETIPIFSDEKLRRLKSPVQYFGGDKDALLNTIETSKRINKNIPQAQINVLKDTGHVIINQFDEIYNFVINNS